MEHCMEQRIRLGVPGDLETLFGIERDNMRALVNKHMPGRWSDWLCRVQIAERLDQNRVWVLEGKQGTIGYYYIGVRPGEPACVYLDSIQVVTGQQGRGKGTRLMAHFLDEAKRSGFSEAVLEVFPENPAIRLYDRFGFRVVEKTGRAITMRKELGRR